MPKAARFFATLHLSAIIYSAYRRARAGRLAQTLAMDRCIIYIMGVSGCGKTTIGKKLGQQLGSPFFDGDDFHPAANKDKMRSGLPLTDEDRAGWLMNINLMAKEQIKKNGAVIACSALKEKYRTVLSVGITAPLFWIFLQGSYELIRKRMEERKGHYMQPKMLSSQFDALEIPKNAITIDISKSPDKMVRQIIEEIEGK